MSQLWRDPPFPTTGNKKDVINWIIQCQANAIKRWQIIALCIIVTFVTYVVTGKLVWSVP